MLRRPFTTLAAISLLICIATILLWVRSYWRWDILGQARPAARGQLRFVSIESVNGRIVIGATRNSPRNLPRRTRDGHLLHTQDASTVTFYSTTLRQRIGFDFKSVASRRTGAGEWHLTIPSWFITLLAALPPATWLMARYRQKSRPRQGFCGGCGYDLRASPTQCPECGTAVRLSPSPSYSGGGLG